MFSYTGLTPKQYSRMIRHLNAILMAETYDQPDWAGIAAESGYADQSHLIRETKALAGISPAALVRERRHEAEISNTDALATAI